MRTAFFPAGFVLTHALDPSYGRGIRVLPPTLPNTPFYRPSYRVGLTRMDTARPDAAYDAHLYAH
jgi:hypothetical protein